MRTYNKMGYFKGWEFGVPVIVTSDNMGILKDHNVRLVYECDDYFIVLISDDMGRMHSQQFSSTFYKYILIDHTVEGCSARFPVCNNRRTIAYCNSSGHMARLLSTYPSSVKITEVITTKSRT